MSRLISRRPSHVRTRSSTRPNPGHRSASHTGTGSRAKAPRRPRESPKRMIQLMPISRGPAPMPPMPRQTADCQTFTRPIALRILTQQTGGSTRPALADAGTSNLDPVHETQAAKGRSKSRNNAGLDAEGHDAAPDGTASSSNRGDRTPIELFLEGVRVCEPRIHRLLIAKDRRHLSEHLRNSHHASDGGNVVNHEEQDVVSRRHDVGVGRDRGRHR